MVDHLFIMTSSTSVHLTNQSNIHGLIPQILRSHLKAFEKEERIVKVSS